MRHEEQQENINLHEIPKSVWCVGSEDIWENLARDRKEDGGGKDRGSGTDTTIKSNQIFLTGGHQQIKKIGSILAWKEQRSLVEFSVGAQRSLDRPGCPPALLPHATDVLMYN